MDDGPRTLRVRGATLTVVRGPDIGRSEVVGQPSFLVGTGDGADLRLADPSVSREHLRISLGTDGIRLTDGGSKNGTYVGGMRMHDVTIGQEACVTIGSTTIRVTPSVETIALDLSPRDRFGDAIGTTVAMRHLFATLERASRSDLTILLEGESGVGKDVLARAVHSASARARQPFVVVDCGAIPPNLVESELFGHERGAFTGADRQRQGVFEEANGGTVFLDEIGELPLDVQPKLLRVLEQREVKPVGGRVARPIDVRVIAATNKKLGEAARTGEFRSDLFYRLAVVRVAVPPLRDRQPDVVPIARAMLRAATEDPTSDFAPEIASMLEAYSWPGNVRELRNFVDRYAVLGSDAAGLLTQGRPTYTEAELASMTYHEARKHVLDRFEERYFAAVVERAGGVVSRAAESAGVARPSFYRMLERVRAASGGR